MSPVLIDHVSKSFGTHQAVRDLYLEVPQQSLYGFIGPNGSGKTTTLRMIMRILHPDQGEIRVLDETRRGVANDRVSYLPEERGLYKNMKVQDVLRFFADLKGVRNSRPIIHAWLDRFGLTGWANTKVEALSKGMAQKVQFIAAVVSQPRLLLLDEPFSGLDPVNAEVMRDAILSLRRQGMTIIFSTHDMATAETMCDFIFMICKGCKVLDGPLQQIKDTFGQDTVRVRLENGVSLSNLPEVVKVTDFGHLQELRLAPHADPQRLLEALMVRGRVLHFELAHPSLLDIFGRMAGKEAAHA